MNLNPESGLPLFVQIADAIREAVFTGAFPEETQIPSTTELSATLGINPATVLKGMNLLVEEGILYKKRGMGLFVCEGASERIRETRRARFFETHIVPLIEEARKLGLSRHDVLEYMERGYEE
jgi:GntR family transcriptional regulator